MTLPQAQQPALSPQEQRVVVLLCRGLTDLEMAAELCVSEITAQTYIRNVKDKLSVAPTRAQLRGAWWQQLVKVRGL